MDKDENIIPSLEEVGCDVSPECTDGETCDIHNTTEDTVSSDTFDTVTDNTQNEPEADLFADIDEKDIIHADGNFDADEWITDDSVSNKSSGRIIRSVYEFLEMLALVTIAIVLCFSFVFRLNIVEGPSMEQTLHTGEYLLVSDLFYDPVPGDIVVVHDMTAGSYTDPIVKRVIAVGGQTVDIDFNTWTLTVDGKVVDESSYRYLTDRLMLTNLQFPITLEDDEVFVMGDNRNHSADSRLPEIGPIDVRCIVGKAYARVFPFNKFTIFKNPYES